jgi:hypothetical protein
MSEMTGRLSPSEIELSCFSTTDWIMYTIRAPAATPQMLPIPPRMTIARTVNETVK